MLIDNIFSNNIEDGSKSGNVVTTISAHYAQFLLLQNLNNKIPIKNGIYHQDLKKLNNNNVKRDLVNKNWDAILEVNNGGVDKSFESFITNVNSIIAEHASMKNISVKERKLRVKPWIRKGILNLINNKNKTYRKYCRAKNQTRDELHNLLKKYRNSINKIIKVSKDKYSHQYFNINKRNVLKAWKGIKEITHCKSNAGQTVNSLRIDGSLSTNQNQIANSFNTFFCNIPKEIEKKLIPASTSFSYYVTDPVKNSLFMRPTDEKEIEQKIKAMKDNKALGPNTIRTKILKVHSKILSKPIAELINLWLNQGKFPTILKTAKVTPIHKRGNKSE